MAVEPIFLDTSFLVAAMIDAHPGHAASLAYLGELVDEGTPLCASLQVCREFMVAVTRKPIGGHIYTTEEALAVLEDWLQVSALLAEDGTVAKRWEQLMERYRVLGKQAHDCNIVATMLSHEIKRLVTRNPADFERYLPEGIRIAGPTTH
jgi:predicted nucleic acid-binding protein